MNRRIVKKILCPVIISLALVSCYSGNDSAAIYSSHYEEGISIEVTPQISMIKGNTVPIEGSFKNLINPTVTYISQMEDIATVDADGFITGINTGNTIIYVNARADNIARTITKEIRVSVEVLPEKIIFTPTSLELKVKQQERINIVIEPYSFDVADIKYWVSDENVILFDPDIHVIKAVGKGVATVNAVYLFGSNELTATCTVTVK